MVEFKDRDAEIDALRMALNMVGVNINYETIDLVLLVQKDLKAKGPEKFSIRCAAQIASSWESCWTKYYKDKKNDSEKTRTE